MANPALTAIQRFVNKVNQRFLSAVGPAYSGLYINNVDGVFDVTPGPLVESLALIQDADEKAYAEQNQQDHFDVRTLTWYRYVSGAWQEQTLTETIVKPGRLYFSPATARVYYCDPNGVVVPLIQH